MDTSNPTSQGQTTPPIAQLRDVILPETLHSYWLAPGWIILLVMLLIIGIGSFFYWRRRQQQQKYKTEAQSLIKQWLSRQNPNAAVTPEQLASLSALLKRVAMQSESRSELAKLHGKPWAEFLNNRAPGAISEENLALLSEGEYQRTLDTTVSCQQIAEQCQRWVLRHRSSQKGPRYAAV